MGKIRSLAIRKWRGLLLVVSVVILGGLGLLGSAVRISRGDLQTVGTASESMRDANDPSTQVPDCQVTVIAILVTPGATSDPRLNRIDSQLRKLIPKDHGYKLLDVRRDRLSAGQTVRCDLGKGRVARVTLIDPLDPEGKAKLHFELSKGKDRLSGSEVRTPLNQLFFCEHALDDGSKLLIGVGAR